MGTYLVVGNQTLGSRELFSLLQSRAADDPDGRIHVVVPETPLDHYTIPVDGHTQTVAEHQLAAALEDFEELGLEASGEIGHENPLQAVEEAWARILPDEVIVSTFPPGASRWLGASVTKRLEQKVSAPITHVIGKTYDEAKREARRYAEVRRQIGLSEA